MSDFSTATVVKATRTARRCFWCPDPLPAGSVAVKIAAKYEGMFFATYTHPECSAAWRRDPCNEDEGCPYPHLRGCTCNETTDREEPRHAP